MSHERAGPRLARPMLLAVFVLSAGCIWAVAREVRAPDLSGDGKLRLIDVPGHRGILKSSATRDGRFVVFATTGPGPIMYVTDDKLVPVRRTVKVLSRLAVSKVDATVLCSGSIGLWVRLVSLPDLRLQQKLEPGPRDEDRLDSLGVMERLGVVGVCAWGKGWVHVSRSGRVIRIEGSPLRFGPAGEADMRVINAVAVDDKTSRLVLCGENWAEVFDLERMETVARVPLGDYAAYSACAADGVAWIATTRGTVLRLDLQAARITGRTSLVDETRPTITKVDISASGRHLAASASVSAGAHKNPTVLKVFRIDRGTLAAIASARVDVPSAVHGVMILEKRKVVVLASQDPVFAWHYGETEKATKAR